MNPLSLAATFAALSAGSALAADVHMPNEGEAGQTLGKIFSFFGGVADYGARPSTTTIHSGDCLELWATFQPDPIFNVAGFAVGTLGISPPLLSVPAGADTFSLTLQGPAAGTMSFYVTVREDDNNDGQIDIAGADDAWETADVFILPGVNVYNLPLSAFTDANAGVGNGVHNFTTTGRMAYFITFETRHTYPGGVIETPVTLLADHIGFYAGPQSIPGGGCAADLTGDGASDVFDLLAYLDLWFAGGQGADLDGTAGVDVFDLLAYLDLWFAGCP